MLRDTQSKLSKSFTAVGWERRLLEIMVQGVDSVLVCTTFISHAEKAFHRWILSVSTLSQIFRHDRTRKFLLTIDMSWALGRFVNPPALGRKKLSSFKCDT